MDGAWMRRQIGLELLESRQLLSASIDVAGSFTTWINSERNQTQATWSASLSTSSVISLIESGFKIV
jgi:hypothetical protein